MEITAYSVEEIKDPTNIIEGKRYEYLLDIEVDEEDELYTEAGIEIRAIIGELNGEVRLVNYFLLDKTNNEYLDFALEEDEDDITVDFEQMEFSCEFAFPCLGADGEQKPSEFGLENDDKCNETDAGECT